jgi:acyl-CoA reductase-like NAD-dependent aldehyde dehydrogenase
VDVERVAKESVQWKYRNAGQVCVAPQRFYVHESIAEEYIDRVTQLSKALVVGNGAAKETQVGPLINARQRDRVEELVDQSVRMGATVLAGGKRPDGAGYFYEPTVVSDLVHNMPLHNEEIFGPVMPIIPFSDTDEVIHWANASDYGLTAFVMTNDLNTSIKVTEALEYGMVCLNDWLPATPEAPFSGVKQSGVGVECGLEGLEDYLETKTIFTGNVQ